MWHSSFITFLRDGRGPSFDNVLFNISFGHISFIQIRSITVADEGLQNLALDSPPTALEVGRGLYCALYFAVSSKGSLNLIAIIMTSNWNWKPILISAYTTNLLEQYFYTLSLLISLYMYCMFVCNSVHSIREGLGHFMAQTLIFFTNECFASSLIGIGTVVLEKKMEMRKWWCRHQRVKTIITKDKF